MNSAKIVNFLDTFPFTPRFSPCWHSLSIVLALSFNRAGFLLRLCWFSPSIVQVFFFDWTERFLWFYWTTEPSTFTRRAFAIATPKARQVDAEPSATSWIQRNGSVNPQMRFWHSPKKLQKNHTSASVNIKKGSEPWKLWTSKWWIRMIPLCDYST